MSSPSSRPSAQPPTGSDELRERLLDAAARVFADQGFAGAKVMDIVREAGLSSGALYGRFSSKNELLTEAVVAIATQAAEAVDAERSVKHLIEAFITDPGGPLTDQEAMQLEAYVSARREPDVAAAISNGRARRGHALQAMVDQAKEVGLVAEDADTDSTLYFLDTMSMGLLLQRAAGQAPPDLERWQHLLRRLLAEAARPASAPRRPPTS